MGQATSLLFQNLRTLKTLSRLPKMELLFQLVRKFSTLPLFFFLSSLLSSYVVTLYVTFYLQF